VESATQKIGLLCATHRGLRVLEQLQELVDPSSIITASFRETPSEPPYLADIEAASRAKGGAFRVFEPSSPVRWRWLEADPVDLLLVASWRYLIPASIHEKPRLGTFVLHDSLLPAYRGFAPSVWALANGESSTGVTLFRIADPVDSGAIVEQRAITIGAQDYVADLMERVTSTYTDILSNSLPALMAGDPPSYPQDESAATYCCKRSEEDNEIDWKLPGRRIFDLIRAVSTPYSGAFTAFGGTRLTIWRATPAATAPRYVGSVPGRVVEVEASGGVRVLTSDGSIVLTEVQLEGDDPVPASDVLHRIGMTLGR